MYQTKQIHYKAIFKQDHDQHKIEYKAKGLFHQNQKTSLDFDTPEGHIQISYDDQEVHLQHGNSLLKFHKEKPFWNQYQLPYGSVALKTKLLKFQNNQDMLCTYFVLPSKYLLEIHFHNSIPLSHDNRTFLIHLQ